MNGDDVLTTTATVTTKMTTAAFLGLALASGATWHEPTPRGVEAGRYGYSGEPGSRAERRAARKRKRQAKKRNRGG